jgi:hypothetical protein
LNANIHVDDNTVDDLERKLCETLQATFRSLVAPNNIWSFDELMFPHNTLNDPLVAFLPRKPHPLGIVAYLAGVKLSLSELPFVFYIAPVTAKQGMFD